MKQMGQAGIPLNFFSLNCVWTKQFWPGHTCTLEVGTKFVPENLKVPGETPLPEASCRDLLHISLNLIPSKSWCTENSGSLSLLGLKSLVADVKSQEESFDITSEL